jgi:hypothetical protein
MAGGSLGRLGKFSTPIMSYRGVSKALGFNRLCLLTSSVIQQLTCPEFRSIHKAPPHLLRLAHNVPKQRKARSNLSISAHKFAFSRKAIRQLPMIDRRNPVARLPARSTSSSQSLGSLRKWKTDA